MAIDLSQGLPAEPAATDWGALLQGRELAVLGIFAAAGVAFFVWLLGPSELMQAWRIQSEKARQRRLARGPGWPWRRPR